MMRQKIKALKDFTLKTTHEIKSFVENEVAEVVFRNRREYELLLAVDNFVKAKPDEQVGKIIPVVSGGEEAIDDDNFNPEDYLENDPMAEDISKLLGLQVDIVVSDTKNNNFTPSVSISLVDYINTKRMQGISIIDHAIQELLVQLERDKENESETVFNGENTDVTVDTDIEFDGDEQIVEEETVAEQDESEEEDNN